MLLGVNTAHAASNLNKQIFEIMTTHCNDVLFNSDGGGVTACVEASYRYNEWQFGYGLYGATAERIGGGTPGDNLRDLARFTVGLGQLKQKSWGDYALQGHVGLEGGIIDKWSKKLQKATHKIFGAGYHAPISTKKTTFVGGVSGWARADGLQFKDNRLALKFQPYSHAALGLDTIEAGVGFLIAFQPLSATQNMALQMPKNGAYLAPIGGDGIGMFAAARVVARETLYSGLRKPAILEFGTVTQYTAFDMVKLGWSASCTTKPYKGAPKADCKTEIRIGYVLSSLLH